MFGIHPDWPWVLIIAGFWIGAAIAFGALVWAAGWFLARSDERRLARRPLATIYELDLNRQRRRQTPHRYAHTTRTTRHGDIA